MPFHLFWWPQSNGESRVWNLEPWVPAKRRRDASEVLSDISRSLGLLDVIFRFTRATHNEIRSQPNRWQPQWAAPRRNLLWQPLIRIVTKDTHTELPYDRLPLVFARFPAVSSAKTDIGGTPG
jgi:hypothetical protein